MKNSVLEYFLFSVHNLVLKSASWNLSEREHSCHKWDKIKTDCWQNICRIL